MIFLTHVKGEGHFATPSSRKRVIHSLNTEEKLTLVFTPSRSINLEIALMRMSIVSHEGQALVRRWKKQIQMEAAIFVIFARVVHMVRKVARNSC